MSCKAVVTEHSGAKNGGVGYYGLRADAKRESKSVRRNAERELMRRAMRGDIEGMEEAEDELLGF